GPNGCHGVLGEGVAAVGDLRVHRLQGIEADDRGPQGVIAGAVARPGDFLGGEVAGFDAADELGGGVAEGGDDPHTGDGDADAHDEGSLMGVASAATHSRSLNFWIFPVGVWGISSMISRRSGQYCLAICLPSRNVVRSSRVSDSPVVTITAQVRSPRRSSG